MVSDSMAVSLAERFSSCLKRKGRSEVEPMTEVMASFTSADMMVVRFSFFAFASAALVMASEMVFN